MTEGGASALATEKFGDLLRRLRVESDLTQEALAERAGLSVRAISDLERGVKHGPRPDTMRMLADGLELSGKARQAFAAAARRDAIPPGPRRQLRPDRVGDPRPAPLPATSLDVLIGRDSELAEVTRLFASGVRLVTLTGPGGVGKTRLALAVLGRSAGVSADGVMVELAPVRDAATLARAVAAAFQLRDDGGLDPEDALSEHLRARQCFLILDNCEQVLRPVAALTGRLLATCPELQLLATSRIRLGLRGEREIVLAPLSLPPATDDGVLEDVELSPAVRLFVERARDADPGFTLSERNAKSVAEIVRRLDGLPLAIELAAARTRILPPAALLPRLHRRLPLLTGGPRDLPERQQTLRNAIAWSYDLLDTDQRDLFRRLAVFNGGFTLDGAEAVGGTREAPDDEAVDDVTFDVALVTGIEVLAETSLLVRDERAEREGEPRFRMLETIREFGLECLAAKGEEDDARRRHAIWCRAFAEAAEPALLGPAQAAWLDRLEEEHDNLRAALDWSLAAQSMLGLRLAAALWRFWWIRGHLTEGRRWIDRALRLASDLDASDDAIVSRAHARAAALATAQGDLVEAERYAETALVLSRANGDHHGIAVALVEQGSVASLRGEFERAAAAYEESLGLYRELGIRVGAPEVLNELGTLAYLQGDFAGAAENYQESLEICRELGQEQAIVVALTNLGDSLRHMGDLPQADAFLVEALVRARGLEDRQGMAAALAGLGEVARDRGDTGRTVERLEEALRTYRSLDDGFGVARCLEGLAWTRMSSDPELATRLLGAADALREAAGAPLPPPLRADSDRNIEALRGALDSQAFALAWTAGRVRPIEETIDIVCQARAKTR